MDNIKMGDKVRIHTDVGAPNEGREGKVIWISRRSDFTGYSVEIPELGINEYAPHELEKLPLASNPCTPISIDALLPSHLGTTHLNFIVTGRIKPR